MPCLGLFWGLHVQVVVISRCTEHWENGSYGRHGAGLHVYGGERPKVPKSKTTLVVLLGPCSGSFVELDKRWQGQADARGEFDGD